MVKKKINIRRKTLLECQLKKFLSFKHNAFCYSLISFLLNTCLLFGSGPMKPFYRRLQSVAGGNELLFSKLCADYFSERGSQAGKWGEERWKHSLLFCLWLGCRERGSLMRNKNFRFTYTPSKCLRQVAPANKLAMLLSIQVYCCKKKGGKRVFLNASMILIVDLITKTARVWTATSSRLETVFVWQWETHSSTSSTF